MVVAFRVRPFDEEEGGEDAAIELAAAEGAGSDLVLDDALDPADGIALGSVEPQRRTLSHAGTNFRRSALAPVELEKAKAYTSTDERASAAPASQGPLSQVDVRRWRLRHTFERLQLTTRMLPLLVALFAACVLVEQVVLSGSERCDAPAWESRGRPVLLYIMLATLILRLLELGAALCLFGVHERLGGAALSREVYDALSARRLARATHITASRSRPA